MDVVLGLGSNLGSREALLRAAVDLIAAHPEVRIVARSSIRRTDPVGPAQPDFLNAAIRIRTGLAPGALLEHALSVERRLARERTQRWSARTIDLDLLWIADTFLVSACLTVPHPELLARDFALGPLLEVAPDAHDPRT